MAGMMGKPLLDRRQPWSLRTLLLFGAFAFVTVPNTVQAHLVTSGVGPFFDGLAHFFLTLDDLLVVVALSLFSGLLGKSSARHCVLLLPLGWLVGMPLGLWLGGRLDGSAWATAITLLLGGLLLGISPKIPSWGIAALACMIGLVHGSWNGAEMSATETSAIASLGIVTATGFVTLVLSATAVSAPAAWQKIAFRVLGSWVAAFGLIALAWHFRPNA
jgi:hydrogenase/urease accessory protein HupE